MCQINILSPSSPCCRHHVYVAIQRGSCVHQKRRTRSKLAFFQDVKDFNISALTKKCTMPSVSLFEIQGECWVIGNWIGVSGAPCATWDRRRRRRGHGRGVEVSEEEHAEWLARDTEAWIRSFQGGRRPRRRGMDEVRDEDPEWLRQETADWIRSFQRRTPSQPEGRSTEGDENEDEMPGLVGIEVEVGVEVDGGTDYEDVRQLVASLVNEVGADVVELVMNSLHAAAADTL